MSQINPKLLTNLDIIRVFDDLLFQNKELVSFFEKNIKIYTRIINLIPESKNSIENVLRFIGRIDELKEYKKIIVTGNFDSNIVNKFKVLNDNTKELFNDYFLSVTKIRELLSYFTNEEKEIINKKLLAELWDIMDTEKNILKIVTEALENNTKNDIPLRNETKKDKAKYSDTKEDILLKTLGIKIKDNFIIRGNQEKKINITDKSIVYFLYYKLLKNEEECFTLDDLSKEESIKKSVGYIRNRITVLNKIIIEIITKESKTAIPNFIKKEPKKRGYHLNPKILHLKSKKIKK
jgi:hypothetical protein